MTGVGRSRPKARSELCAKLVGATQECERRPDDPLVLTLLPYHFDPAGDADLNQFLLFMKPELSAPGVDTAAVVQASFEQLEKWDIEVRSVTVWSGTYLRHSGVMQRHYETLNRASHEGLRSRHDRARARLNAAFPVARANPANVVGAHAFLQANREFSSLALETLARNLPIIKLGAGLYAMSVAVEGTEMVIINPFHPWQLEWLTRPGSATVALTCLSVAGLREVRHACVGEVDPASAFPGSLRREFYEHQRRYRMSGISTGRNGFHISPGLLEAMFAIVRSFDDRALTIEDTSLGRALLARGHEPRALWGLATNPVVVTDSGEVPIFELTEELERRIVISIVERALDAVAL